MTYREIRLDLQGAIAELTLARADTRNAMTVVMGDEVSHAVSELNAARHVRALIVRGDGKGFSSGGDFKMLEERARATEGENRVAMRKFYESFLSIRAVRVPTLAILHGAAMGAGLCFALACDLRLAATGTKLGANFVRVGLHPGMGATWLLPRLLGPARASELLYTGESLDADEALRIGLVNRVYPAASLDSEARKLAERIAEGAPVAMAQTKASLTSAGEAELDAALDREARAQAVDFATADLKEALAAFAAKRAPQFQGG